jgi:flagellar biosynthesis protein FlhF
MRLKTFRAAGMAAAMAQVRAELGSDALILSTRRISGGIEITAALEPAEEPSIADPGRLATLAWHGVPPELQPALADGDLEEAIARTLAFGELPLEPHGKPVMLAGPPGAGKTLTTARLATRLVMKGISPLVITTDGSRAGAVEQLAAFTRLLGVSLLVASNPTSLARALMQRQNGAPVLIDTAGTDPFDAIQTEDLRGLAAAADAQIAVVLPCGLDRGEAADLAVAYDACGAHVLIVTRLDIVRRLGGVIAAASASRLPLTEAGVGPGAADGLISFTPSLLAARLTHIESTRNAR